MYICAHICACIHVDIYPYIPILRNESPGIPHPFLVGIEVSESCKKSTEIVK